MRLANCSDPSKVVVAALLLAACGNTGSMSSDIKPIDMCPPSVPAAVDAPMGQALAAAYEAQGVQIYICMASGTSYAWTFKAPRANLLDTNGNVVGMHFAGPTWQFQDGSSVVGMKLASATVTATAIPWLLLQATSTTNGTGGAGRFSDVTYVQRLATGGGVAPTTGCDASHVGAEADVQYTATYFFYHPGDSANQCR
jgi:hypothetical protein